MEEGCKLCEKYKEHYCRDHMNGKGVEFYELMHGDFSQHLRIPKKFTHYCRKLPETVDLKGPSGKIWPVGLRETNDGILLQSGWKEFVEAHHIQQSYLLVFKYNGRSCFDISIFDENCCKKAASYLFMENNPEEQERSDKSMEVLNAKSRSKVVVGSSSDICSADMLHAPPFLTTHKIYGETENTVSKHQRSESSYKKRIYGKNKLSSDQKNKQCNPCSDIAAQGTRLNIKQESVDIHNLEKLTHPNLYISGRRLLTYKEEERALHLLHLVQPKNPCFISFLQPSNVYDRCYMYVPARFQRAHLPFKRCAIFLKVPGQGKRWCFDLFVYSSMTRFCWQSFVIDNGLHAGDACLFELVDDPTDIVMTVSILRAVGQDG